MREKLSDVARDVYASPLSEFSAFYQGGAYRTGVYGQPSPVSDWEVKALSKKKQIEVTLFDQDHYGGEMPSGSLIKAIAWFQKKLEAIPVELRKSAELKIGSTGGYEGDHYGHIEITYKRPETDEEYAARKADVESRQAYWKQKDEERDRAEFERLAAKFRK